MPNVTSGVNLNNTVYRQITSGGNPYFNNTQTYSVPSYPNIGSSNPLRKPASTSTPLGVSRPVKPVYQDQAPQTPNYDMSQVYKSIGDAANSIKIGDGGLHDATVDQMQQKANQDLATIANSENPQATLKAIKNDPFYAKSGFADAMMGLGLSIMSGASPMEAFNTAQNAQKQGEQEDRLNQIRSNASANQDELLKQYTSDSVANYIATGDASQLRERQLSLEEKRNQQLEDQAAQDAREDKRIAAQDQRQKNMFDYQLQRQQQVADQQQAKADAKQLETDQKAQEKVYSDITKNTVQLNKTMRRNESTRLKGFDSSLATLEKGYFKPGATETDKQAALQLASETAFNAIQGSSTAEKTQDKINEMLGQPGIVNIVGNKISWATGIPRDQQAKYLQTLLKMDKGSWEKTYNDDYYSQVDANIPEGTSDTEKKKILASVSKGAGRKLTLQGYNDWYDSTYNGKEETPSTRGTLSSGNTTPTTSAGAQKLLNKFGL